MFKSTKSHKNYWRTRSIDWKQAYFDGIDEASGLPVWDHPHRQLLMRELSRLKFGSVLEVGCATGANLYKISQTFPGTELGGIDVSAEAIEAAKSKFSQAVVLQQGSFEDLFYSDKSADLVLSDAALIYVGPETIHKAIEEMKRVARKYIVLVEFHAPTLWERLGIAWKSGYYAYNYKTLLESHGLYDIEMTPIPERVWGYPWSKWGRIIIARV